MKILLQFLLISFLVLYSLQVPCTTPGEAPVNDACTMCNTVDSTDSSSKKVANLAQTECLDACPAHSTASADGQCLCNDNDGYILNENKDACECKKDEFALISTDCRKCNTEAPVSDAGLLVDSTHTTCAASCPDGEIKIGETNQCRKCNTQAPVSDAGLFVSSDHSSCGVKCGNLEGIVADDEKKQCIICGPNNFANPENTLCVTACGVGQLQDGDKKQCKYCEGEKVGTNCATDCASNTTHPFANADHTACTECDEDQEKRDGACVCLETNFIVDQTSKKCVCDSSKHLKSDNQGGCECETNYVDNGSGVCVCDSSKHFTSDKQGGCECETDYADDGNGVCVCDSSKHLTSDNQGGCECEKNYADDGNGVCAKVGASSYIKVGLLFLFFLLF